MKKRTRKNSKKGGSPSSSSSSSGVWEDWKTNHSEIMTTYNDSQSTTGSLTAGLFGWIIYSKVK
jgi:hypothetical protein